MQIYDINFWSPKRRFAEAERRIAKAIETSARRLSLNDLKLGDVPASAKKFTNLRSIILSGNRFALLPEFVSKNVDLTELDISDNQITSLPESMCALARLRVLRARGNQLTTLPSCLRDLPSLKTLDLRENPGLGIPPEILTARNRQEPAEPADILSFYFRQVSEETRSLNEAKILLVGQGGVGKTSLVKRLLQDVFDPDEQKTEGISIRRWTIPANTDGQGETVQLNIWDFGGQEIMHATHQFFLTKRSLYLLVLDARKGENESNIHYWLKIIQSYGGDAPVIVVTNKSDAHNLELNETRLRKDYAPNIVGFFRTSCLRGIGIAELSQSLTERIHELPHVYDMLPKSYFSVKRKLEDLARERDFIDISEYQLLCANEHVETDKEQTRLLRFLHDLGSVLNFDDPSDPFELRDTNILNPEWVTGGVYRILNSNMLMQAGGILRFGELHTILGDGTTYPRERHRFILEMMRKFELCFDFPDTNGQLLLIPELLSRNEPDIGWQSKDALNFEYHYRVLPPGLICRFIVRMHSNLTDRPTYWRSGVVLEIDGNKCLVRADSDAAKIFISVGGAPDGRRRALSVIRNTFKSIHDTIPRIEPVEKVPLPDTQTVVVDYRHLVRLEDHGVQIFLPEGAEKEYSVAALLEGIEIRPSKKRVSPDLETPANVRPESTASLWRLVVLSTVFVVVLIAMIGTLTVISGRVTSTAFTAITIGGVVFTVLFITMVAAFAGVMREESLRKILELVLSKVPGIGGKRGSSDV